MIPLPTAILVKATFDDTEHPFPFGPAARPSGNPAITLMPVFQSFQLKLTKSKM